MDIKKQLQWSKLKVGGLITLALLMLLIAVFTYLFVSKIGYENRVRSQRKKIVRSKQK